MIQKSLLLQVALCLLLRVSPTFAGPTSAVPIKKLSALADAIVVAEIVEGSVSGPIVAVSLQVERVLKGTVEKGRIVQATYESLSAPATPLREFPRHRGLWFLNQSADGRWSLLPTVDGTVLRDGLYLSVAAGPLGPTFSYGPSDNALDKSILEMCAGVADPGEGEPQLISVRFEGALFGADSPAVARCYNALADSSSTYVQALGLSGLIGRGDIAALRRARNELNKFADPTSLSAIASGVFLFRNPDPEGIRILGELATSETQDPEVVYSAAYSLRVLCTKEALPYMVRLLDSPSQQVRYQALAGLASFANVGHVPLTERLRSKGQPMSGRRGPFTTEETLGHFPVFGRFQKDEAYYIDFWKSWWTRMESKILE